MTPNHSRNPSEETTSTASYNMILEHVMQYPGSYEIPLRTMYTLNCAPRAQPLPKELSRAPSPNGSYPASPISGQHAWTDAESTTMNFTSALMSHMCSLPSQPSSLPPSFIVSFVSRCFHPCLSLVDFPQALTALDYLKDLENRRRKEVAAAFERLDIRYDGITADVDAVSERYPGIALWAKNIEGKSRKAVSFYCSLYLGLRRWILVNELSLQPFNQLNCVAMLNTLLPPQAPQDFGRQLIPLLTPEVLAEERSSFFVYIRQVKRKGPSVLQPVMDMQKEAGDENGWDSVQRTVDKYLRVAKNMIDDCISTTGTDDFTPVEEARKGKKTDSGISFGSDRRPSTGISTVEKPLPVSPPEYKSTMKGLSRLERITREFRRMRVKTRPDVEEIVKIEKHPAANYVPMNGENKGKKSLKKARSLANIGNLKSANASSTSLVGSRKGSDAVPFDPEEMKRQRLMYEASTSNRW
ncbi:uncharacterized protein BDR25DRAFT_6450 [Lindgomyces ingoldianus]|uniref:Uncharacterized protein n=1 Tax=Lindgomyces ingoldianus TaxID=673940 RepID=A0ACB6RI60_9PLEO|nr:uncharacterized protein BDR25DRAFT_6450 [Lindgomyces ingoldianus]KAF2478012.1 hypothetical protein BDR25DRAFT_6450 [Lindgomyces ingoldianus]